MREGRKGFGTYRVCPEGMEPDVSEFVVPAEREEDFAVAFEEVHLERKSRRQLGYYSRSRYLWKTKSGVKYYVPMPDECCPSL